MAHPGTHGLNQRSIAHWECYLGLYLVLSEVLILHVWKGFTVKAFISATEYRQFPGHLGLLSRSQPGPEGPTQSSAVLGGPYQVLRDVPSLHGWMGFIVQGCLEFYMPHSCACQIFFLITGKFSNITSSRNLFMSFV